MWNAGNQLVTYYNQAGSAAPTIFAQYDYSGMNRVSKLVKTGTTYQRTIYIDGIFEYHKLENGTTYEKNEIHIMDDKSRIAMVRVGTPFPDDIVDAVTYNLEDQIGSSSVRLNTYGTVIDREEYYPYGDSSLRTFTKKRYRYVGKEKDLESGLYYYGARYYLAWTCRFISVDPLAHDYPFYTPYNYAGNKPINRVDIDGMQEGEAKTGGGGNAPGGSGENAQSSSNSTPEEDNDGSGTVLETIVIHPSPTEKKKEGFWSKAGKVFSKIVDNIPVVGGVVNAIKSASKGDWKGVMLHTLDAVVDGVLLATTGGFGNAAKIGAKAVAKQIVKTVAKETAENLVASETGIPIPLTGKSKNTTKQLGLLDDVKDASKTSTQLWTSTSKLSSVKNAFKHWKDHGKEFPEFLNAKQYVEGTKNFMHNSPAGTLMKKRANGDILKYHPGTNTFGVMDASGVPRTMFKPTEGMQYWLRQK